MVTVKGQSVFGNNRSAEKHRNKLPTIRIKQFNVTAGRSRAARPSLFLSPNLWKHQRASGGSTSLWTDLHNYFSICLLPSRCIRVIRSVTNDERFKNSNFLSVSPLPVREETVNTLWLCNELYLSIMTMRESWHIQLNYRKLRIHLWQLLVVRSGALATALAAAFRCISGCVCAGVLSLQDTFSSASHILITWISRTFFYFFIVH